jgi:hypothetical protein
VQRFQRDFDFHKSVEFSFVCTDFAVAIEQVVQWVLCGMQ